MSRPGLASERENLIMQVEISKLFVGKTNVRKNPGDVRDLAESIREKGVLEPVLARPVGTKYELIIGSRRFAAAKEAGLKKIPAVVREMGDEEAIVVSLVENVQRRDIEPEEEYDALMELRRLNPKSYGSAEQLARALGKSRKYIEDRINAVEVVRSLRKEGNADIEVKQAPRPDERREGVLPVKHATFLHKAQEAPSVQELPRKEQFRKLTELAHSIAEMPRPEAENVVSHFVMAPERSVEKIVKEAASMHTVKLEIVLDPRVAEALRKAAEDRGATMEAIAGLALHSWLRQQGYA
ncbi:MAG TPA: ParB/RepB/Spo0J family partition protein [Nitrososphaerales archaeon]|nr:ParB/RepB/Spo0J family partition protein [Nitrososphaerales archaeon]